MTPDTSLARATRQAEILEKQCADLEGVNASLLKLTTDLTFWLEKMTISVDSLLAHQQQPTGTTTKAVTTTKAATVSPEAVRAALEAMPQDQLVDILLKASLKVAGHEIRPGRQATSDDIAKAAPKAPTPTPEEARDEMWKRVIAQAFKTMPQEPERPVERKK